VPRSKTKAASRAPEPTAPPRKTTRSRRRGTPRAAQTSRADLIVWHAPPAAARPPVAVVQEVRAVHAHAHQHPVGLDQVAPLLVQERGVRLEGVLEGGVGAVVLPGDGKCPLVEAGRQHERLPRVPDDRKGVLDQAAGEDALEDLVQYLGRHPFAGVAIGQVAVGTIQVAEGGGLKDEQLQGGQTAQRVGSVYAHGVTWGPRRAGPRRLPRPARHPGLKEVPP
jgi:hypothetical protein